MRLVSRPESLDKTSPDSFLKGADVRLDKEIIILIKSAMDRVLRIELHLERYAIKKLARQSMHKAIQWLNLKSISPKTLRMSVK